jgi:hypothetical protein
MRVRQPIGEHHCDDWNRGGRVGQPRSDEGSDDVALAAVALGELVDPAGQQRFQSVELAPAARCRYADVGRESGVDV